MFLAFLKAGLAQQSFCRSERMASAVAAVDLLHQEPLHIMVRQEHARRKIWYLEGSTLLPSCFWYSERNLKYKLVQAYPNGRSGDQQMNIYPW
jgi:hypothetical protein